MKGIFLYVPQGVSLGLHHARSAFFTTVRSRFFTAGFSPLFTRPQAVKRYLSLASEGACLGVGEAEDGSHTLKPALARVTYNSVGRKPKVTDNKKMRTHTCVGGINR